MRRRMVIAAVAVLIAGAIAWWLWPEAPPPVEASREAGAGANAPPEEGARAHPWAEKMEVRATTSAGAGADQAAIFKGRVSASGSGQPVAGATVTFFLDGAHDVMTGGDGSFEFKVPRPGTYELRRLAAEGFVPYEVQENRAQLRLVARPGAVVDGIELELEPMVRCTGRVTRQGRPVAGVRIECVRLGGGEARTDADGAFSVACAQEHYLWVADTRVWREVGSASCRWDVELKEEAPGEGKQDEDEGMRTLRGHVVDERGRPVENVRVVCLDEDGDRRSTPDRSRTDGSGAFECDVPKDEEATLLVPGVPSSEQKVPATANDVTLVIPELGRIRGTVRDVDGQPVPMFVASADMDGGLHHERAFITADGTFDLGEVTAGRYQVQAVRPGFPPSDSVEVEVRPGETAEVNLALKEGLTIRGIVLDAVTHRPIAGARVAPPDADRLAGPVAAPQALVTTDLNGRFAISRVALDGAESVMVSAAGYNGWLLGIREAELREVTIELTPSVRDAGPEFGGVGMGMDRELDVTLVVPSGPAGRAGVVIGDQVVSIDGQPAPDDLPTAISQVRGPLGTQVEIQFKRADGGVLDASLRRERIATQ